MTLTLCLLYNCTNKLTIILTLEGIWCILLANIFIVFLDDSLLVISLLSFSDCPKGNEFIFGQNMEERVVKVSQNMEERVVKVGQNMEERIVKSKHGRKGS